MLQSRYRFHGRSSLQLLFKQGRTFRGAGISIRYAPNPRRQDSRAGIIVSRKVLKSAPARNRARRRLYECLRKYWPQIRPGCDMLISLHEPRFCDMPAAELDAIVRELLTKTKLIDDHSTAA